jgi:L-ascorbate metabolism protein UlaG (beta-lactamase superfamily)
MGSRIWRRCALASLVLTLTPSCVRDKCRAVPSTAAPRVARQPLALTYLGVASWSIESAGKTIVVDPFYSRPNVDGPIASDPAAVAKYAPKRADLIVITHSHYDHLLDAAPLALATDAQVVGSTSSARVVRAAGVPADHVVPIQGGEDYAFDGYSVRVIPSLHSALDDKHLMDGRLAGPITVIPPVVFDDWREGGTFSYLVRLGGHEIFVLGTANFIESEIEGMRPDIAIIAPGLRQEIHDYTCRLMRALGNPPLVYATHFDNHRGPPVDEPLGDDTKAFVDEVRACSPKTRVVVPKHFERMQL